MEDSEVVIEIFLIEKEKSCQVIYIIKKRVHSSLITKFNHSEINLVEERMPCSRG